MAKRTDAGVKGPVFIGIGSDSMKQNAQTWARIIRDLAVRTAKGNHPAFIGDDIVGSLFPKPDEICGRNVTETSRDSGADTFKSRGWPAVGKILRDHCQLLAVKR